MKAEFSAACANFYRLTELLEKQELHFETLLHNAQPYAGQTNLKELDRLIRFNRKVQAARAEADKTETDLRAAQWLVLQMMRYFEIPPNTRLTCEIPEEVVFELWADDDDQVYYEKITDLDPEEENPNIITIIMNDGRHNYDEDDEE